MATLSDIQTGVDQAKQQAALLQNSINQGGSTSTPQNTAGFYQPGNATIGTANVTSQTGPINTGTPPASTATTPDVEAILKDYLTPNSTETSIQNERNTLYQKVQDILGIKSADTRSALEASQGIPDLQKQLADYNQAIRGINSAAFQTAQNSEGRLAPTFNITGEQAQIERQRSAQTYGLAAAAAYASDRLAAAQTYVSNALNDEFKDRQNQIDYYTSLLQQNRDQLTDEQKKKADVLSAKLQEATTQTNQNFQLRSKMYDLIAQAQKDGNPIPADVVQKAIAADPSSAIGIVSQYLKPTNKYQFVSGTQYQPSGSFNTITGEFTPAGGGGGGTGGGTAPGYKGEFAATIDIAANAFGTNQQRNQVKQSLQNFIAQGDYKSAYATIVQATAKGLTGSAATNFEQQQNSLGVLDDLKTAIQKYAAAGGDTNIFKGTADQIQTKLGILQTDPRYAALAVQLTAAFQQYRLQMTGAAFGAKESAEYASILPDKSNTLDLNLAKLDGAHAFLDSSVKSSIRSVVGDGGVYIKEYADGATKAAPAPTTPLKTGDTGTLSSGITWTIK